MSKRKKEMIPFMIDHRPIQRGSGTAYDWGYEGTITAEMWKPITQCHGVPIRPGYWISSEGKVFSEIQNKFLEQYIDNRGRPFVKLRCIDGKRRNVKVYRLVLEAWVKNPMPKLLTEINHRDGNPLNSALANLGFTTSHYNKRHSVECLRPKRRQAKDFYAINSDIHIEEIN